MHYKTPPLEDFTAISGHTMNIRSKFQNQFMVGYIESHKQVLYGLLQDDLLSVTGVIISDISGNDGVFIITKNADATNNEKQICIYLRKQGAEYSETCVADPKNRFHLYGKTHFIGILMILDKTPKQIELDTLSQLTDDQTHTLSEPWMWNG